MGLAAPVEEPPAETAQVEVPVSVGGPEAWSTKMAPLRTVHPLGAASITTGELLQFTLML